MSIDRWFEVVCDRCGIGTDVMPTPEMSRDLAVSSGWHMSVNYQQEIVDLCSKCVEELRTE